MGKKTDKISVFEYAFYLIAAAAFGITLSGLVTQFFVRLLLETQISFWQAVGFNVLVGVIILLGARIARRN